MSPYYLLYSSSSLAPPIITSINGDTDLDLTENATLTCSVSSPVGVNITWSTSANVTVPDAVTTGNPQTGFNSSITIPSVTLAHDEAVFVCTAVNTAGSDTDSLTLSVMSKFVLSKPVPQYNYRYSL